MDLKEKIIDVNRIYEGKKINVDVLKVKMPNNIEAIREIVDRKNGVVILAIDDENNVIVEEQYRNTFKRGIVGLPAGKRDGAEDLLDTAKRELEEETGYKAESWVRLGEFYPAPAYSNEIVYPFLATGLYLGNIKRDPDEFLNIIRMPIKEFEIKCMDGTIKDGRTLMTWMKYSSIK